MKIRNIALVFSLLGAGAALPIQAAPVCTAGDAASYVALGSTGCTINTAWTFSNFKYTDTASGINTPSGGLTDTEETITPLGSGGVGFSFTPTVPWSATGGGVTDVELQYVVTFTSPITSIFQSISGSVVPPNPPSGGFDNITDDYCPGTSTLPPGCSTQLFTSLFSTGTASNSASFAGVNSIAVLKDVSANSAGFPGSSDAITAFTNCFNGTCAPTSPVPEPASYATGLLGLGLLALTKIRFARS